MVIKHCNGSEAEYYYNNSCHFSCRYCNNYGNCSHEHVNVNTGSNVFIKYKELLENAKHVMSDTEITFKKYINNLK